MQLDMPDRFFHIDLAGHASPLLLDGDCAAGVDVSSFNAAISACEKGTVLSEHLKDFKSQEPPYSPQEGPRRPPLSASTQRLGVVSVGVNESWMPGEQAKNPIA
eukprot:7403873-Karenia_brevis.AAC.1